MKTVGQVDAVELFQRLTDVLEGYKSRAYLCQAGKWTCGYGATEGITKDTTCTKEQALAWLRRDSAPLFRMVQDIPSKLQQAALVSFGYNCGADDLERVLQNDLIINPDGFFNLQNQRFGVLAGGKVSDGLKKRRALEAGLILIK